MFTASSSAIGFQFEKLVADIFCIYGFYTTLTQLSHDNEYDILATKDDTQYLIEVKYSRKNYVPTSSLYDAACRLKAILDMQETSSVAILVVGTKLKTNVRMRIESIGNIIVLDIGNLLFLVQDNEPLKREMLSILDFSVNDLLPEKPNVQLFDLQEKPTSQPVRQGDPLKERIANWVNSNGNTEYENLCYEALNYLFDNELALWHRQQTSNADLYRFDLICKIKDGEVSGLWSTILQCFNSKYIIFEFKNYTEEITQKEIYTTDKYLYLKALRGVAIIISCKGTSPNADKAIRGTLRENGKLILSINNSDLLKMIDIKMSEGIPADYLYAKFDELLIDLEK